METNPIIIIGAGPAGLSAAIELAKGGKKALVFDKNKVGQIDPRGETKLCGGGLTPRSQRFLGELSCEVLPHEKMEIEVSGHKIMMDTPGHSLTTTIDRDLLAIELLDRAKKAGAEINFETAVTAVDLDAKTVVVQGKIIKYEKLVAADGAMSQVRRQLAEKGIIKKTNKNFTAIEYKVPSESVDRLLTIKASRKVFPGGYGWIFPHKHYCVIGAGETAWTVGSHKKNLKERFIEWVEQEKLPYNEKSLRGWTIPYDYQGYYFLDSVYLVGDAAGFADGFLGEGISQALLSGHDVAHLILDKNYNPVNIETILLHKKKVEGLGGIIHSPSGWQRMAARLIIRLLKRPKIRYFLARIVGIKS